MSKKLRVEQEINKNIYVHNDIANAAHHLSSRIESNKINGIEEGISLDIMSCLIMLAFEFEAKVNFIGHMKIKEWNERDNFHNKTKTIYKSLKLNLIKDSRPYKTILTLKDYRDSIAHGKPLHINKNEIIELLNNERNPDVDLENSFYDLCTIEFMRECKEDIDKIWNEWLTAANIEIQETFTHGSFSTTVL
ncbi:hypothetical protein [uncultured Tolumonas sp.]|uniref:hypothetical protein n=1 Tax=uncultured Tolumonas sp. TaxID=263765 RepID=UPI002931CE21